MSLTKVTFSMIEGAVVNALDYGAVGDGVANDTTALQAALAAVVAQGGTLRIPAGTYNISGALSTTSLPSPKKPFQIIGDGVNATVLNRLSGCGTMMNLRLAPDGVAVRDMTFNVNASTAPTNANHTLVVGEASNVLVDNIVVNDPRTGGVMILSETSLGGGPIQNCLINNVRIFGVIGGSNIGIDVGILYAGLQVSYSGITNCYVKDVGKDPALSPGDGIELKYTGPGCYIENCYVENATQGFGFANDGAGGEVEYARISNIHAKNCIAGITGLTNNSVFTNVIIDMDNNAALLEPIQMSGVATNYTNVVIKNLANAAKFHTRFIGAASRNYVQISEIYNVNSAKAIASFESGCVNNVVVVENMTTPAITSMVTANIILDQNTDKSLNRVNVNQLPKLVLKTIDSGAIKIANWDQVVYVDTESAAASDDLDTITSGFDGQTIILRSEANARDVVVKHDTGNIKLVGGADFTLNNSLDSITLSYDAGNTAWTEISRADVGV
jgi:hypothetical protein